MSQGKDIRWEQRFQNYNKALGQLTRFLEKTGISEMEEQGLIKAFEYTYELSWNLLKDFLKSRGSQNIFGSRDAISEGFKSGLIADGETWMEMYKDRNRTSHTYNEETASEIAKSIRENYISLFKQLQQKMQEMIDQKI